MRKNEDVDHLEEPVAYFANHYGISMPIVPFTVEQNKLLSDPLFVSLLRQLGFHLHEGKLAVFPRLEIFCFLFSVRPGASITDRGRRCIGFHRALYKRSSPSV